MDENTKSQVDELEHYLLEAISAARNCDWPLVQDYCHQADKLAWSLRKVGETQ
jgi:hypothetical protein